MIGAKVEGDRLLITATPGDDHIRLEAWRSELECVIWGNNDIENLRPIFDALLPLARKHRWFFQPDSETLQPTATETTRPPTVEVEGFETVKRAEVWRLVGEHGGWRTEKEFATEEAAKDELARMRDGVVNRITHDMIELQAPIGPPQSPPKEAPDADAGK